MSTAIVLLVVLAILFVLAFLTRRRFGTLGLGLAAGSILSELWSEELTPIIRQAGLEIVAPPLISVVAAALVLLPAILLLFKGQAYKQMHMRIIGAVAFALLAFAFLLPVLGDSLQLNNEGQMIYSFVATYRPWIITIGIVYAIVDMIMVRGKHESKGH